MLVELIKLVCKKYEYCSYRKDRCPFYDKNQGECCFLRHPESWPAESEILKKLEESNNE